MAGEGSELSPRVRERGATNGSVEIVSGETVNNSTYTSPWICNPNAAGVYVFWEVTAAPQEAAGTATLTVQVRDPYGDAYNLWSPAAITAVASHMYLLYPASDGAGGPLAEGDGALTDASEMPLPRYWCVTVTASAEEDYTFNLSAAYVP